MTTEHPIGLQNLDLILSWLESCIDGIDEGRSWQIQEELRLWDSGERLSLEFLQPASIESAKAFIAEAGNLIRRGELSRAKRALFDAGSSLRPDTEPLERT